MILFHVTSVDRLGSIARDGLVPQVPGVVWNDGDPALARLTGGKPVVWLTTDPDEWRHDAGARLLTVSLAPNSKRLVHYLTWLHRCDPAFYDEMRIRYACEVAARGQGAAQNVEAWHVYLGTIRRDQIVDGLGVLIKADTVVPFRRRGAS
jgi:hypothetical protein